MIFVVVGVEMAQISRRVTAVARTPCGLMQGFDNNHGCGGHRRIGVDPAEEAVFG
jgi:hypothetical protein